MERSGIYKIRNLINGHIYIGSAINVGARWRTHKSELNNNKHGNRYLQRAWLKYGADAFEFSVMEECEIPSLIAREQHFIDTLSPEYNICRIAGSMLGFKPSEETLAKLSAVRKGRPAWNKGTKGLQPSWNKGKTGISDETRAKMSASAKGKPAWNRGKKGVSDETSAKISEAGKGRTPWNKGKKTGTRPSKHLTST